MSQIKHALEMAINFIGNLPFSLQRDLELRRLNEALAELEKQEPVIYVDSGNLDLCASFPTAFIFQASNIQSDVFNTLLYTSPQQREWVGLPAEFLSCFPTVEQHIIERAEKELRELNTKG